MKRLVTLLLVCSSTVFIAGCGVSTKLPEQVRVEPATPAEKGNQLVANAESNQADSSPTAATAESKSSAPVDASAQGSEPVGSGSAESSSSQPTSPEKQPTTKRPPPKPGVVQAITFDDLNCGMQADIVFRPWMLTERVKELDGQRVSIAGYMHPDAKQKGITEFILLRNTECKFGPAGQADHLIQVRLTPGVTTRFSVSPIEVVGILKFNPFTGPDGNTWSIFEMDGESVGTPRHRPPAASAKDKGG